MRYDSLEDALREGMNCAYWAERIPDAPAIVTSAGVLTFREFDARTSQFARAMRRLGLRAGDAVALICPNQAEWAEVWFGALRCGLRVTPINYRLQAEEAAYIIGDCEARAVVAGGIPDSSRPLLGMLPDRVTARLSLGLEAAGFDDYEAAVSAESPAGLEDPVLGGWMMYTSGTTGRPKGVYRASRGTAVARSPVAARGIIDPYVPGQDMHLCTGPLYHSAINNMSLHMPLSSGAGVVIMPRFDAEEALALIQRYRVTQTHMVPTMFHRLLQLPSGTRESYDLSSLRQVIHGAAPCPVAVKHAMIEWLGPIIFEYFGMTEAVGGAHIDSETWLRKPGSVGLPVFGTLMIADEDLRPRSPGETGLIYFAVPDERRFEYFHDEAKTAASFQGDWLTLGDMGYLDDDGYLFLTDRSANLIISGGVNIYPAEVDEVLLAHPAVSDVATIGVPNDEWGEEVKAVVQLAGAYQPTPDLQQELVAFCRDRLAHYKCPKSVDFVGELPRQENGKIYKRLLREQYRAR
jgi:long-chain acyl-CoA synthetase